MFFPTNHYYKTISLISIRMFKMPRVTVHSFNSSVCHGCSHRIHDAYAFMLGVYRGHTLLDKKKKEIIRKKGYLQILTIWKHAHLCVTSTKVNQPNKLKACMYILYIHYYIYIGHTLYGRIWLQPCDFFYSWMQIIVSSLFNI